jgi:hypothetical protein
VFPRSAEASISSIDAALVALSPVVAALACAMVADAAVADVVVAAITDAADDLASASRWICLYGRLLER